MKTAYVRYSVGYCMLYIVTHIHLCGDDKKANKLIAPYREKLRSSDSVFLRAYFFDIYDQGPAGPDPAGGPARPVQLLS